MMASTYFVVGPAMAITRFEPYVSNFEFAPRFHPTKNPNCPNARSENTGEGNEEFLKVNFPFQRSQQEPEDGSPVGRKPSIEIRAILVRCANLEEEANNVLDNRKFYNMTPGGNPDILDFHGFVRNEQARHSEVRECRKKLIITMKFNNVGRTKTQEEFVVIDHVLDPITMHKARLLNPFVVKVRQEPVLQLYGLKFQGVVNAEASEEVINEKMSNYTGCDDFSENPTCGQMIFQGKPIPYSQGFCCSCDPELNSQRETSTFNDTVVSSLPGLFLGSKNMSFEQLKSVDDKFSDEPSNSKTALQTEATTRGNFDGYMRNASFELNSAFSEDNDSAIARNSSAPETELIRLKSSNGKNKMDKNLKTCISDGRRIEPYDAVNYRKCLRTQQNTSNIDSEERKSSGDAGRFEKSDKIFMTHKPMKPRYMTPFRNSDHVILSPELAKLKHDHKNLGVSNRMRMKSRNNKNYNIGRKQTPYLYPRKYSGQIANDDGTDDLFSTDRIKNAMSTRVDSDHQRHISNSVHADKLPLPAEEMADGQMSTLSIDVLFAISPKLKSTTCPADSTGASLTEQLTERRTTQSVSEARTLAILRQKLVSYRVYPSQNVSNDYKFDRQLQKIGNSNSMETTTHSSRKFDPGTEDKQYVTTSGDTEFFNRTEATNSENSIVSHSGISKISDITFERVTINSQQPNDPSRSFNDLSDREGGSANLSSSSSSENRSRGDAIVLSGFLKNQLANKFSHDGKSKARWKCGEKKSKEDDDECNGIRNHGKVEFSKPTILKKSADNSISRHLHDDLPTTAIDVRRPIQIYLKPYSTYSSSYQTQKRKLRPKTHRAEVEYSKKDFLKWLNRKDPDVSLWNNSERPNISRSYRSIANDDSFARNDNEKQRSIDKKIEDEFVDISDALKDGAKNYQIVGVRPSSESMFEEDDSVIDQLNRIVDEIPGESVMENRSRDKSNSMLSEGDYNEGFVGTNIPQAIGRDRLIDQSEPQKIGQSEEIGRQDPSTDSNARGDEARIPELLPVFIDVRKLSKYNSPLTINDHVPKGTAAPENNEKDDQSKIIKHTEILIEPISEIPQTTGHQIVIDRFKLVKAFQKLPRNNEQEFEQIVPTSSTTYDSLNVRRLKGNNRTTHAPQRWTSIYTSERDAVIDIVRTLGSHVKVHRSKPVSHPQKIEDNERRRENVLRYSDFENILSEMHNRSAEAFSTDTIPKPMATVMFEDNSIGSSNNSLRSALSPALMIENLKNELRKEAESYSSGPSPPLQSLASTFRYSQAQANFHDKLRAVTTQRSPVDKINDLVTDEGTLPPGEETKLTTSVQQIMIVRSTVGSDSVLELAKIDDSLLPRLAIWNLKKHLLNNVTRAKEKKGIFVVFDGPSKSLSTQSVDGQRASRNKRLLIDMGENGHPVISPAMNDGHAIMNEKSENEDDEHPWFEATTNMVNANNANSTMTMKSVVNIDAVSLSLKNLKHREMIRHLVTTSQTPRRFNAFPNKATANSANFYVSLRTIPESNGHSRLAGLRIKELPKVNRQQKSETAIDFNADELEISTTPLSLQESQAWKEVDELPIFQRIQLSRINEELEGEKFARIVKKNSEYDKKIRNIDGSAKGNFQTLSTSRFRSFYPKSNEISLISETVVDNATDIDGVEDNNKREDSNESDDDDPKALIFYNYDAVDTGLAKPTMTSQNYENNRSLESYNLGDKKDSEIRSRAKSSGEVLGHSEHQLPDRNNSVPSNSYFNTRLDKEEFIKNQGSSEIAEPKRFSMPDTKLRRSEQIVHNQFEIEPPSGWKDKMELLKLKKHADVLKEYLNWRHDIVPPEPHEISDYTTKISMMNEKEGEIMQVIPVDNTYVSSKTPLTSTVVPYTPATDDVSSTTYVQKDLMTTMDSKNNYEVTHETNTFNSSASWSIPSATNDSRNCLFNKMNSTIETSNGYARYGTKNKVSHDTEPTTGRILPPCCPTKNVVVTTSPTGLRGNVKCLSGPPDLSKFPHAQRGHNPKKLYNVNNDLVIISVMEKNRLENKNVGQRERGGKSSSKMDHIRNKAVPDLVFRHRSHKSKDKVSSPSGAVFGKARSDRRPWRRLMSVEYLDYKDDEDDSVIDNFEGNENALSFADEDSGSLSDDEDSRKLQNKWSQMIDKVILGNSAELWKSANFTKSLPPESSDDNRSVMKELHFVNADKYIKQMASKIAHSSSIHSTKNEPAKRSDESITRNNIVLGRTLKSHSNQIGRKIVRKVKINKNEAVDNYKNPISDKRSISGLESKFRDSEDANDNPRDLPASRLTPPSSARSNISLQSGRDFAISLSGKIHVEGGTNGQPMSISFDTSPEIANKNEAPRDDSEVTSDSTNSINAETDSSPNFLSNLFNIASVPTDLAHHSQKAGGNSSATLPRLQSPRATRAKNLRRSRGSYRRKFQHRPKKSAFVRKSRAVDEETAVRWPKDRFNRSFDLGDTQDSHDPSVGLEFEDYPESFDNNNDIKYEEMDNTQSLPPKQRNPDSAPSFSDIYGDLVHKGQIEYRPDFKVIKIIPLNGPRSGSAVSSSESRREDGRDGNNDYAKTGMMTASDLSKLEDNSKPEASVKMDKIKPVESSRQKNDGTNDESGLQGTNGWQQYSIGSGSCSPASESAEGNSKENSSGGRPVDDRISTSNPVNLKVISLVSMDQTPINGTKSPADNHHADYKVIPLIRVNIEQQPYDQEKLESGKDIFPSGPGGRASDVPSGRMADCPRIDMTQSSRHFHDDGSRPCSDVNDEAGKTMNGSAPERLEVAPMDMESYQEPRKPSEIGSCADDNRMSETAIPNLTDDNKFDRIRPTEESHLCGDHREMETTSRSSCQDTSDRIDARKWIRSKNMLAIMEFIKKIRGLMSGEETGDTVDRNNEKAVLNLATVIVLPINRSKIVDKPTDLDYATENVVMIGEGVNHESRVASDPADSETVNCDGTVTTSNTNCNVNEDKSNNSIGKVAIKDQDKSFLFYDNDEKIGAAKQATSNYQKFHDPPSTDKEHENFPDRMDQAIGQRDPFEAFNLIRTKATNNVDVPRSDESIITNLTNSFGVGFNNSTNANEVRKVNDTQRGNESNAMNILKNLRRKINDRLWGFKRNNVDKIERQDDDASDAIKERSVADNELSSVAKTKCNRLRSNEISYRSREPRRQIHRSRSVPVGEVSQLRNKKFSTKEKLTANRVSRGGKRRKNKKKKKKKKKKKHGKKGKVHRSVENSEKPWWPFRRQLMSFSKERQSASDISLDQDDVEGTLIEGIENSWVPVTAEHGKIRTVHRNKFPRGENKRKTIRRNHEKLQNAKTTKKKRREGKFTKIRSRSKRQISSDGTQVRGGQSCIDRKHPVNVNPARFSESAHCLRFSDLWYSVYVLEDPIIEHTVYIQLFEKRNHADGMTHWEDLTQGSMVRMGTFTRHQRDNKPTIAFAYSASNTEPQNGASNLDPSSDRLLVPSPLPPRKASNNPEIQGHSGEYLVVKSSSISTDGNDCDKAGVGFTAFSKQKDRCNRTKGSCLKNQPLDYSRHDTKARESGRRGCYFLSNFASVPTKPIRYNVTGTGNREYLGLEYHSTHVSTIDIEVRTDYNAIVRVGFYGRVTEVHVDSTALEHTVVTVVMSNMDLASSYYQPRITDCPKGLPDSWIGAKGIMQVVPPQHDRTVTLDLYGRLMINEFHCSVEVINNRGELVAMRRIIIQRMNRCVCMWHCLCACIGGASGLECQPMSPEHYQAAGFQGPVPVVTAETSVLVNTVKNVLVISAILVLLLLVLGMLKWFVGMFASAVGRWGLDSLLQGSRIEEYLEPELRCRCVMTDDDGCLVHPDTGQRTVRICSRKLEFFLNLIFFLTYPIAVSCMYCKGSLNSSAKRRCCYDESRMCLINEKESCPKMICVSTYGDNRNSKLEAEDTRYVMNELKKSQESLQHPKRSKKTDGNTNSSTGLSKKSSHKNKSSSEMSAKLLVNDLLKSRIVFRNLRKPVGGLKVSSGTWYSLRGYFLNVEGGGYRFITPCPFKQHWLIENTQKKEMKPPETYPSNLFMRSFGTDRDVYESNELSLTPIGVCINVQYHEDT